MQVGPALTRKVQDPQVIALRICQHGQTATRLVLVRRAERHRMDPAGSRERRRRRHRGTSPPPGPDQAMVAARGVAGEPRDRRRVLRAAPEHRRRPVLHGDVPARRARPVPTDPGWRRPGRSRPDDRPGRVHLLGSARGVGLRAGQERHARPDPRLRRDGRPAARRGVRAADRGGLAQLVGDPARGGLARPARRGRRRWPN